MRSGQKNTWLEKFVFLSKKLLEPHSSSKSEYINKNITRKRQHGTQYASKFGKLSLGHRTGKGQFSFQSHRKAMPKNAETTTQLYSSHMLAK